MFNKILVCLDGSRLAEQVLPYATEMAQAMKSKLVFFTALSTPVIIAPGIPGTAPVPVETGAMAADAVKEQAGAEAYLEKLVQGAVKKGVAAEKAVITGLPGPTIMNYAASNGIGLITIATHGRGGLERAVMGSVADYLLRHSQIPVFVVRPKKA